MDCCNRKVYSGNRNDYNTGKDARADVFFGVEMDEVYGDRAGIWRTCSGGRKAKPYHEGGARFYNIISLNSFG